MSAIVEEKTPGQRHPLSSQSMNSRCHLSYLLMVMNTHCSLFYQIGLFLLSSDDLIGYLGFYTPINHDVGKQICGLEKFFRVIMLVGVLQRKNYRRAIKEVVKRMTFTLQNSTIEKQRGVSRFLTAEGVTPAALLCRIVTVYGEDCVSDKPVRKCSAHFRAGRENLVDDPRSGQANSVITADLIDKVDYLVRNDRPVTLRMLAMKMDVSVGTVWTIVQEKWRYRKVCAQWAVDRQAQGTAYGASISISVSDIIRMLPNENFLVGADLNGHNPLWGYHRTNTRGVAIMDFLLANNLFINNSSDAPPTFTRNTDVATIIQACNKTFKIKKQPLTENPTWWTDKLEIEKKRIKALRRRAQRSSSEERSEKYLQWKTEAKKYMKKVKRAKNDGWKDLCTEAANPYGKHFKAAFRKTTIPSQLTVLNNISPEGGHQKIAQDILEQIFPFPNSTPS
ncbi:Protein GVQW3 like protein [Argiope bruennichi]|uniref:Protein GVQW3 like protein n=1 Tax=Argiope bruennichi TaxID=94029 RepID=A0A8T0EY28_ARGBR|nr:Protein GVQW3 like protein [Argiope bruennichi]